MNKKAPFYAYTFYVYTYLLYVRVYVYTYINTREDTKAKKARKSKAWDVSRNVNSPPSI